MKTRAFSLIEVLIAGSLALLITGIAYLLYAQALHKSLWFTKMAERASDISGLSDILQTDAESSAPPGLFVDAKKTSLALFVVDPSRIQLDRTWSDTPLLYHWQDGQLSRLAPKSSSLVPLEPQFDDSKLASILSADRHLRRHWSGIPAFEIEKNDKLLRFRYRALLYQSDGRQQEFQMEKVVNYSL